MPRSRAARVTVDPCGGAPSTRRRRVGSWLATPRTALLLLAGLLFFGGQVGASQEAMADPATVGALLSRNLLARDYMFYGDEALHYAEAAAAVGALRFAEAADDAALESALVERYAPLLDDASPLVSRRAHVDMAVLGIVPLQIALQTGSKEHLAQGLGFADAQWEAPLDNGLTDQTRWWIDDLYMVGMLQIQAYRATGNPEYADRAARQLAAYLPELQRDNGLFFHSPDAPVFWGRGNGWVAVAMAEVLASLPETHPLREDIVARFQAMMAALLPLQGPDGLWRQVLDQPDFWPETSATAMFAYSMALGIEAGLLDERRYTGPMRRAWTGLALQLDAQGNLAEVCVGTGKEDNLAYYRNRPRVAGDLHGQAPMLWLAVAFMRAP